MSVKNVNFHSFSRWFSSAGVIWAIFQLVDPPTKRRIHEHNKESDFPSLCNYSETCSSIFVSLVLSCTRSVHRKFFNEGQVEGSLIFWRRHFQISARRVYVYDSGFTSTNKLLECKTASISSRFFPFCSSLNLICVLDEGEKNSFASFILSGYWKIL